MNANDFYRNPYNDPCYVELFERALDLELVEEDDRDNITLEDVEALLSDLFSGY